MSLATHNCVLPGQLGVNLHLVRLLAGEEYDNLYQTAHITEVHQLYATVRSKKC